MMKVFFHSEHCCATCEHWLGPRIETVRGCVHAACEFSGLCLNSGKDADTSGVCGKWELWRSGGSVAAEQVAAEQKTGGWSSLRLNG